MIKTDQKPWIHMRLIILHVKFLESWLLLLILLFWPCFIYLFIFFLQFQARKFLSFLVAAWHGHPYNIYSREHSRIWCIWWFIIVLLCLACTIMSTFLIRCLVPLPFYLLLLYILMNQSKALSPDGMVASFVCLNFSFLFSWSLIDWSIEKDYEPMSYPDISRWGLVLPSLKPYVKFGWKSLFY